VWLNTPTEAAQAVTLTLSGASASDFGVVTGAGINPLGSDGTFTVTIPAGQTSVSFSLVNTGDVGSDTNLTLTATLPDTAGTVSSDPLTLNYVEPNPDPFTDPQPTGSISGDVQTDPSTQTQYTRYQGDGANDSIVTASGLNAVDLGSGNDLVQDASGGAVIAGGVSTSRDSSGNLALVGASGGNGNNVVTLNGNADVVIVGNGDNKIYGKTEVDITTAVTQANSDAGIGKKGAFLSAGDGNNTIEGGDGNDLMLVGTGENVIVLGPGADTVLGGVEALSASVDWSTSPLSGYAILTNDVSWQTNGYTVPADVDYEGNVTLYTGIPFGLGNDTIFGGSGAALIYLSNGDNAVELGTGSSTVFGGMGDNTIIGGGGDNYIRGGGGSD
jgi:Ca2+-binding RTX toxin-like protein